MKTKTSTIKKNSICETIKKLLLFLMFTVIIPLTFETTTLFAQSEFNSENQKQKVYYDSLLNLLGHDSMQGTGYTQYKRWYRYWAPKLNTNYDYDDYQSDLLEYANNYVAPLNNGAGPNWRFIGPDDIPTVGTIAKGIGQIHYIYRKPEDMESGEILYACSPVGGLFKSSDNGDSWFNLSTDKGLPRSGVSSVVGDNFSYSTLYVTTGNGEGFDGEKAWQTAIGVWRTNNDGATWENIGLQYDSDDSDSNKIYHMRKIIDVNQDPGNNAHLIVTTTEGLYSTTNASAQNPEWEELINGEFYDVVQYGDTIYASGSNSTGIYKYDLENNIATKIFDIDTITLPYDTMVIERPELRRISVKITNSTGPDYLFAVFSMRDYNFTSIYRYNLSNGSWHKFHGTPFATGYARKLGWDIRPGLHGSGIDEIHILGMDARNPLGLFYNGLSNDDSVKTIKANNANISPHVDLHHLLIEEYWGTLWACTDGGVYKGEFVNDSLIDWTPKSKGLGVSTIEFLDAKDNIVTSGQFDCGSNVYTSNDEINWEIINKYPGDGYQNIIHDENLYYLSGQTGIIVEFSEDGDNVIYMGSDENCASPGDTLPNSYWETYYVKLQDKLYAAGRKEVMIYNYNNNSKWIKWSNLEQQIGCAMSGTLRVAVALANDGQTHQIYASAIGEPGVYEHLFKSIDGGGANVNKWVRVEDTPATGRIQDIEITAYPNIVLVAIQDSVFSVNTSTPASPTWQDLTYDLNAGVINSIFRDGNTIWLGAEYGVFYLESGTTSWVDYSSETLLPNCEVKDIKVHRGKVYAGTYGRGVWFASTPDCGRPYYFDTIAYNGQQVPSGETFYKYWNFVIDSGNTYNVYGTLKMGDSCRIIVEPGGKLVVDGGTITKACPDLWQGIEVRGNSNAAQNNNHQGWVELKNGATIEYAVKGIETIKNHNGISDLTFAGGVIQAENSLFKNNKADIVFFPYPDPYATFAIKNNISYFKNTGFVTDSNYYFFSDDAVNHVSLNDVFGVTFEGNLFTNSTESSMVYSDKRGIGIISWNAGFFAKRNPDSLYGNVFEKLNYGIYAFAYSGNNRLIEIDSNTFDRNQTGCYLSAETNAVLTHNTFYARPVGAASQAFDLPYTGLYLDHCTGYLIMDNEFRSGYSHMVEDPPDYTGIGAYIYNSGPEDNFIYDNYFHNMSHATIAYGRNRDKGLDAPGLQYKCNNFENNFYDIVVIGDTVNPSSFDGIAPHQGSAADTVTAPAGNRFSKLGKSTYCDFNNQAPNIIYHLPFWEVVYNFQRLRPDSITYNTIVRVFGLDEDWNITDGCPSYQVAQNKSGLKSDIVSSDLDMEIYADSLDLLVDDGNTLAMNLDVTSSLPPETMELRDELLAASPYLSDTVMVNAAAKEDVLPNSIITEVLSANPQSAKSEKVLSKLDERDNPPNENQMAEIHANDTIIGHKESLESKRSFYAGEKARTVYELARLFMRDTLGLAIHDSIASALTNISTPTSHYLQAFCYLNTSDSLTVLNLLNNIPSAFDLDDIETDYHDYFMDYFDMLLELQTQEINAIEIDDTKKTDVADIMNNSKGLLHAYVRNLLMLTDGLEYNEPYVLPDTSSYKSSAVKETIYSHFWDEESYFKLYPNPANGYITFEYKLDYNVSTPVVEVISVDGVHVSTFRLFNRAGIKIIDLRDWKSGTYIIRLSANGKMLQSAKFVKF